jgi:hypothetical protein
MRLADGLVTEDRFHGLMFHRCCWLGYFIRNKGRGKWEIEWIEMFGEIKSHDVLFP